MDNNYVGSVPLIEIELPGGARGLKGDQGPKGDKGDNYNPIIEEVETLEPTQPATAEVRADDNNIYFSFGIPKGEPGEGTKLSDFDNDVGFVTADTTELENYALISNTYTKTEVDNSLSQKANTSDVTTSLATKVNVSDVIDNLTSTETAKPLSANQGKILGDSVEEIDSVVNGDSETQGTGTTITLQNTTDGELIINSIGGDISQEGTPTPTSPIEIQTVTGSQKVLIYGEEESNEKIINLPVENLFDKDNANLLTAYLGSTITNSASSSTLYIPCSPNTTYTISRQLVGKRFQAGTTTTTPEIGTSVSNLTPSNANNQDVSITITTGNDAQYLVVFYSNTGGGTGYPNNDGYTEEELRRSIQIEKGSHAHGYTNYGVTPIELCKIGDYRDRIYKDNGKWYIEKKTGKVVLNGTTNKVTLYGNYGDDNKPLYYMNQDDMIAPSSYNETILFSDVYTQYLGNTPQQMANYQIRGANTRGRIYIRDDRYTSANDLNTWLSNNNVTVYYVLATPTTTEITNTSLIEQLNALDEIRTYKEQTNISITGNLPAILDLKSYTDTLYGNVESINNDINKIKGDIEFIFPKFMPNAYSGDANLIKYKDTIILVDSHSANKWTYIKDFLDDNDVSHIDYFILTHYHADHVGNFKNLVKSGYINSTTKLYMPAEVTTFNFDSLITEYKQYCTTNNLQYHVPEENEVLTIDGDLKITFANCDKDIIDAYTNKTENSCSTVFLLEYKDIKAFYAGDATIQVYNRLNNTDLIKGRVDLYKIAHHGIDMETNESFIRKLAPIYAVQPSGIIDAAKNNFGICPDTTILKKMGTKIYPYHTQTDYIKFIATGDSINCVKGIDYYSSNVRDVKNIYVDITASKNAIQDGTEDHPYSELMQAISSITDIYAKTVNIYLADGHYCVSHETPGQKNRCKIDSFGVRINIYGNSSDRTKVIVDNVYMVSSYVNFYNLSLNVDNYNAFMCYDSRCILENVLITSLTQTSSTHSCVSAREGSLVWLKNCKLEYGNEGLIAQKSAISVLGNITFGTMNSNLVNDDSKTSLVTLGTNVTFLDSTQALAFSNHRINSYTPLQILDTSNITTGATSYTLLRSVADFDWINVYYKDNYNYMYSTGRLYNANNNNTYLSSDYYNGSTATNQRMGRLQISETTLTLNRETSIITDSNGSAKQSDQNNYFTITRVEAGWNDTIDLNQYTS